MGTSGGGVALGCAQGTPAPGRQKAIYSQASLEPVSRRPGAAHEPDSAGLVAAGRTGRPGGQPVAGGGTGEPHGQCAEPPDPPARGAPGTAPVRARPARSDLDCRGLQPSTVK